ncbi:MAG: efflux RND transporter periplasmic adaptor subunit [Nannocystaceae bacterium]
MRPFLSSVSFVSILSICAAGLSGCQEPPTISAPAPRAIKYGKVQPAESAVERSLGGTVRAVASAPLSFGVGGTLQELNVDVGDTVTEGQVLARLDDRPFKLNVRAASANVEKAKAAAKEARTSLDSFTEMYKSSAVSTRQYDQQVAREASARSEYQLARAQVELSKRDRSQAVLEAPFAGSIVQRDVDNFEEVRAGQLIVQLQGEAGLEVVLQVPESIVGQLQIGQRARVTFPSDASAPIEAELSSVAARSDSGGTFEVTALLNAPGSDVRAGMTANVLLDLTASQAAPAEDAAPALKVPFSAVFAMEDDPDASAVFVYDKESSTVQLRAIKTGDMRGDSVIVESGLTADEIVATAGTSFLSNGMSVTLWEG